MGCNMFCYQCEQTAKGQGCTTMGVCGKEPETAKMQDLLLWQAKGIAMYAHRAGLRDAGTDHFILEALFTTVTNVNFDAATIEAIIRKGQQVKEKARAAYERTGGKPLSGPAAWVPPAGTAALLNEACDRGIEARKKALGDDAAVNLP